MGPNIKHNKLTAVVGKLFLKKKNYKNSWARDISVRKGWMEYEYFNWNLRWRPVKTVLKSLQSNLVWTSSKRHRELSQSLTEDTEIRLQTVKIVFEYFDWGQKDLILAQMG